MCSRLKMNVTSKLQRAKQAMRRKAAILRISAKTKMKGILSYVRGKIAKKSQVRQNMLKYSQNVETADEKAFFDFMDKKKKLLQAQLSSKTLAEKREREGFDKGCNPWRSDSLELF